MTCLWCFEQLANTINWQSFFTLREQNTFCDDCLHQLKRIEGDVCSRCFRESTVNVCSDCHTWEKQRAWKDVLTKNVSVFHYNEMMKQMIAKWKYRGDYVLTEGFRHVFKKQFNEHFRDIWQKAYIVPIPLSDERLEERAFNQAQVLTQFLPRTKEIQLTRVHHEKQAKKTRHERLTIKNPFILRERVNKPVILVDDIYTTGITLRYAARTLKNAGCPAVYSFTLARG